MNNAIVTESLKQLGKRCIDSVTGFEGVVSSVCFDLYGCVMVAITPSVDKDGKIREGAWFDIKRVVIGEDRVMLAPPFVETEKGKEGGAAEKPRVYP
jgi:hypothetical protein